jgi:outer membrane lipopolysaccharide assembly protein LptE/RlpB
MRLNKILSTVVLGVALLSTISCGYQLAGRGNQIPDHIKSIYIPDFDNKTSLAQAEQFVTFAIRDEFIKRTRLKLIEDLSEADSSLEGEISNFIVKPLSSNRAAQSNLYNLRVRLKVRFVDLKTNQIIYENKTLSFSQQYTIDTGDFFSQSSEAMTKISTEFSASIVSIILENF